jgi:hypothetical protein
MLPRATSKSTPRSTSSFLYDFSKPWTSSAWTVWVVIGTSLGFRCLLRRRARSSGSALPAPG